MVGTRATTWTVGAIALATVVVAMTGCGSSTTNATGSRVALNAVMQVDVVSSLGTPVAGRTVIFTATVLDGHGNPTGQPQTDTRTTDSTGLASFAASFNVDPGQSVQFEYHTGTGTQTTTLSWTEINTAAGGGSAATVSEYDTITMPNL